MPISKQKFDGIVGALFSELLGLAESLAEILAASAELCAELCAEMCAEMCAELCAELCAEGAELCPERRGQG